MGVELSMSDAASPSTGAQLAADGQCVVRGAAGEVARDVRRLRNCWAQSIL
jgi:hypothetical protein